MITTVTIWVCKCGAVSHLEGSAPTTTYSLSMCPALNHQGRHSPKPVIVMVPYA